MLRITSHSRRIQHRHWQWDCPDPKHLKDPETEEGEEFLAHFIKAVIFAGFQDTEEEERCEAQGPGDEKERDYKLAAILGVTEWDGYDSENNEVGATGEVCAELCVSDQKDIEFICVAQVIEVAEVAEVPPTINAITNGCAR